MRRSTRRRYYGRSNVAGCLQEASNTLAECLLRKTIRELEQAATDCEVYNFGGKRLINQIKREKTNVDKLLEKVRSIPVFQEEKILAKQKRHK